MSVMHSILSIRTARVYTCGQCRTETIFTCGLPYAVTADPGIRGQGKLIAVFVLHLLRTDRPCTRLVKHAVSRIVSSEAIVKSCSVLKKNILNM